MQGGYFYSKENVLRLDYTNSCKTELTKNHLIIGHTRVSATRHRTGCVWEWPGFLKILKSLFAGEGKPYFGPEGLSTSSSIISLWDPVEAPCIVRDNYVAKN